MDWIKKRYDQLLLGLAAILLLAFAVLVILKAGSFGDRFAAAAAPLPPNNKIPPLEQERIAKGKAELIKSPFWVVETRDPKTRGSLFISEPYYLENGQLKRITEGSVLDTLTRKPIPNRWFKENGFNPLLSGINLQDPDKDGFANEDEWRAEPQTDPNNKDSHPLYHTKLFLQRYMPQQFRLIFKSYNGEPKNPKSLDFQIDTLDLRQPSAFLKIGEMIPKTKFRIDKFEFKEVKNPNTGEMTDVSELTLSDTESGDPIVLVLAKVVNSPDVFGLFDYQWPHPPTAIRVKKLQEFVLQPETDKRYKLVDINETQAVIQLPDGGKYTVLPDPRKAAK